MKYYTILFVALKEIMRKRSIISSPSACQSSAPSHFRGSLCLFLDLQRDDPRPAEPVVGLPGSERRFKGSDSGGRHHRGVHHQRTRGWTSTKPSCLVLQSWWENVICLVNDSFHFLLFRSWSYWWRATSSALRSRQQPIRHHHARTPCCRWPSSSKVAVAMCCRRSASHDSSWSTLPAPSGQRRRVSYGWPVVGCRSGSLPERLPLKSFNLYTSKKYL